MSTDAESGFESMPILMSPKTLAEQIEVSVAALSKWRKTWPNGDRIGPAFSTPRGTNLIRYARPDVISWLNESHPQGATA